MNSVGGLAEELAARLMAVPGVVGVVLGGSHATGRAGPDSDLDLGVYYDPARALDTDALQVLAREVTGDPAATVTRVGGWGPRIDGGGWLRVGSQAVDVLYRSLDRAVRAVDDARSGQVHVDVQPGHPLGFPAHQYAAELHFARVLRDPSGRVSALKARVATYPAALGDALETAFAWQAAFWLDNAMKGARRGDAFFVSGCAVQAVGALVQVLFARARVFTLSEKGSVRAAGALPGAPEGFAAEVEDVLGALGRAPTALLTSVERLRALAAQVVR